jgi:hypothetical protein
MAVTPLTNTISTSAMTESILKMLKEWLERPACFGTSDADVIVDPTFKKESPIVPEIYIEILNTVGDFTPANGSNRIRNDYVVQLQVRVSRSDQHPMLSLNRAGDKMWGYWKNRETGKATLGASGLRRSLMSGPFSEHSEHSYAWNYILTFEVTE